MAKNLPFNHYEIAVFAIDEIDWDNDDVKWDYDDYSDLFMSSCPEWDNIFRVSVLSSRYLQPKYQQLANTRRGFFATQNIDDSGIECCDIINFGVSFEKELDVQ